MAELVNSIFCDRVMDRTAMKQLISRLIAHFGIAHTTHVLDQLKTLGFQQATLNAISLGIDDLSTAPSRGWLIGDAERYGNFSEKHHSYGNSHAVERLRQLIETWYATSEYLKQEMNPNFRMIDPSNPVHMMSFSGARGSTSQVHQLVGMRGLMSDPQGQIIDLPIQSNFREGLSLTEYIISCYGARKGVVDTAVRTSDAGYLTRRLVEVVQHIVVRKTDCGTFRGIPVNNLRRGRSISHQELIGRVLAESIYINNRCFATRNQDIGAYLANESITSKVKTISIRSPLTCRSMLWICQLCYGWSPMNGNLVEMGEAVGIIAGQSIGEPGTQLTLRTFHTGGVFTGDIAEHIRTPFNGIVKFDENLVYPTRTRHGHPAWMCCSNLLLSIRSRSKICDLTIPPRSLLLVRNGQYVESKQVIAEIRARTSPLKEKVQKYVYSNSKGEMHWSAKVYHASVYTRGDIHSVLETCHIWILSGDSCNRNNGSHVSFYENQDRIDFRNFFARENPRGKNRLNICILSLHLSRRDNTLNKSRLTHVVFNDLNNSVDSSTILYGYRVVKKRKNLFLKKKYTTIPFTLGIRKSGTLRNNDVLATLDHPKYELEESGIVKYGTVEINSVEEDDDSDEARTISFQPRYKIVRGGNFFLIPEKVHVSSQASSTFPVRNNEFIQAGEPIVSNFITDTSGLVRIRRGINNTYEVKILPGTIYYPNETYRISKQVNISIPPGKKLFNRFRCDHRTYLQWIIPPKEKPFVLMRSAIEYEILNGSNRTNLLRLLRKGADLEIKTVNYLLCGDGERIQIIDGKNIRLIQTCLIVHWRGKFFSEKANASFSKIRTRNNSKSFLQITLIDRSFPDHSECEEAPSYRYVSRKNYYDSSFSICRNRLINKHRGVIRISSDLNSETESYTILSSSDFVIIPEINRSGDSIEKRRGVDDYLSTKFFSFRKHLRGLCSSDQSKEVDAKEGDYLSTEEESVGIIVSDGLGLIGYLCDTIDSSRYFYRITHAETISLHNPLLIHRSGNTFRNMEWYFIDEYYDIYEFIIGRGDNHDLLKWFPCLPHLSTEGTQSRIWDIGQFLFGNFRISKYAGVLPSGQIIGMRTNCLVIRSAKPYLTTGGATIHHGYGESINEGDILIKLIYERLQSGDIIQGLPRVEQLLEARPVNSVSINPENGFEDWSSDMKGFIGNFWGFFLSTRIGMEEGQIVLVDQIRKVYQSQGVRVSNKHIEIIVRQMTSKVATSEDGAIDIFLPGELIECSRAQRMNRVLEEAIPYEPVLLGITKASLNAQSFIPEASSQETTRVLARAALKGRIDRLKGLKENVILGGIIPAGTGSREVIRQIALERGRKILPDGGNDAFDKKVINIFLYGDIFPIFPTEGTVRNVLRESVSSNGVSISSI